MNRNDKNREKLKIFANALYQKCMDNGVNMVAVTSTCFSCADMDEIMAQVCEYLTARGKKVAKMTMDESAAKDASAPEVKPLPDKELTFAVMPSFDAYAGALLAAKEIGSVCLIERLRYTEFKTVEALLAAAQANGLRVIGAAAVQ